MLVLTKDVVGVERMIMFKVHPMDDSCLYEIEKRDRRIVEMYFQAGARVTDV